MNTRPSAPLNPLLSNALQQAFREIDDHPEDSIQDIVNECLLSWKTGLRMNSHFEIVPDQQ